MGKGLFDNAVNNEEDTKATNISTVEPKVDFESVHQAQQTQTSKRVKEASDASRKKSTTMDDSIAMINNSGLGGKSNEDKLNEDIEDMNKISDEDLDLAEELIFKGYAETVVKIERMRNLTITVCSMTAGEMAIVEEMMLDYVSSFKDELGELDSLPSNNATAYKQLLEIALSIKAINDDELSDKAGYSIQAIKRGISKYDELQFEGDIDRSASVLKMIKEAIKYRVFKVKSMSTPVIDLMSTARYNFNVKMFDIMNIKDIVPK